MSALQLVDDEPDDVDVFCFGCNAWIGHNVRPDLCDECRSELVEPQAMCDRCRLDWPVETLEIVEFTELEEQWCPDCRERRKP